MATIDDVLIALRNNQPPPADERVWVLAEVNPQTKKWDWTTHNIAAAEASPAMFSVALSLHDRAVQLEQQAVQAATPAVPRETAGLATAPPRA